MNAMVSVFMLVIFFYTFGFSRELWKTKNKRGSIAVFMLAVAVVILPFFTVFRN